MGHAMLLRILVVLMVSAVFPFVSPGGRAQEGVAGIGIEVLNCPEGMSRATLVSSECVPITEGFDALLESVDGSIGPLAIADATFDGRFFVWDVSSAGPGMSWYLKETTLPGGYSDYTAPVEGGVYDQDAEAWRFTTFSSPPRVAIAVYNFAPGDSTTVTIHKASCPANVTDLFGQCHENRLDDIEFDIDGFPSTTDENGVATHEVMPGKVGITEEWLGYDSPFIGNYAYCSVQGTDEVLFNDRADGGYVEIDVAEGDQIICDWYNLTPDETQTFPITVYTCETDPGEIYPGQGIPLPEDCSPIEGVTISAEVQDGAAVGDCVTDVNGRCDIESPAGAWLVVSEDEDTVPLGYAPRDNPIVARAMTEFAAAIFINLPVGGVLPTATATRGPVIEPTEVPIIGRPAHIHPGVCGRLKRDPLIDLNDVISGEGDFEGSRRAAAAEGSYTLIDESLDDLLATDHSLNVHQSHEEMGAYVVCGEIGGPRREDGSIAIGLREVNGAGYEGIAYLAPNEDDPGKTDVWVFIARKLAEEERITPAASPVAGTPVASPEAE